MKKLIAVVAFLMLTLTACSHTCEICGSAGADMEVMGVYICDGCLGSS